MEERQMGEMHIEVNRERKEKWRIVEKGITLK